MVKSTRSIRMQKPVTFANLLPATSRNELYDRIGLMPPQGDDQPAFRMTYRARATDETPAEFLTIDPGDVFEWPPLFDAADIMYHNQDFGLVKIEEGETVESARVRALNAAFKYWNENGSRKLDNYRMKNNFTAEEMQNKRFELTTWFLNAEKAKILQEELLNLRKGKKNNSKE